jgi:hypothetical protein
MLVLHRMKPPGCLLQTSNQMGLTIHRSKDKVTCLRSRSLEMEASLCSLPGPSDPLSYKTRLGNFDAQAPENGLGDQRHRHPKRG